MQAHFLRYSCEIFTTKTCYVENKNIRLSIEKMRKRRIAMLRMRMCCCRISGGGSSNRLFTTGGFIIVPPSCTITHRHTISPLFHSSSLLPFLLLYLFVRSLFPLLLSPPSYTFILRPSIISFSLIFALFPSSPFASLFTSFILFLISHLFPLLGSPILSLYLSLYISPILLIIFNYHFLFSHHHYLSQLNFHHINHLFYQY